MKTKRTQHYMLWHVSLLCHGHYFGEIFGEFPLHTQMTDFKSRLVSDVEEQRCGEQ